MSLHGWDPETQVVFCQVTIRSCVPAESRPSWCHRWWNRKGVRPIVVGHFVQANFIINGLQLFVGWVTRSIYHEFHLFKCPSFPSYVKFLLVGN